MKDEIIAFLSKWPRKWHTRKVADNTEYRIYLDNTYPKAPLNMQIWALIHGASITCVVCGEIVKSIGKATCSTRCRENFKSETGGHERRIEKAKKTMVGRYGVDNPSKLDSVISKRKSTMLEKYGALVSPKSLANMKTNSYNLNVNGRMTLFERYGVENPGQLPDHGDKCKQTMVATFGKSHYSLTDSYIAEKQYRQFDKWQKASPQSITFIGLSDDEVKQEVFANPNRLIDFRCNACSQEQHLPSETFKWRIRHGISPCKICANLSTRSAKEVQLGDFMRSLGVAVDENVKLLDGKEIDIYVPSLKLGIEFHGLFWHNDMRIDRNYHYQKYSVAKQKGITLIQIFEDEWDHKRSIVEERLRHIMGLYRRRIYARKCEIREIVGKEANLFVDAHHLQGSCPSTIKLGAYFGAELVAVMTFAKLNRAKGSISKDGHWEISRFCTSASVVGIAGKLFAHFLRVHCPMYVMSYSDLRWQTQGTYEKIGMVYVGNTRPNYWYINASKTKRIHRYALRKNSNDDQSLTEYENRVAQGYTRIWDCGHAKYEWRI